jgi:hypothetical protein
MVLALPQSILSNEQVYNSEKDHLRIFAKSGSGKLTIWQDKSLISNCILFDSFGRKIKSWEVNNSENQIDLALENPLSPGVFFLKTSIKNRHYFGKFLISN